MPDSIVVSHATKVIRGRVVLDDVTFSLPRGGIYGFSGINGSGKTMLFRAISGLIHLTSGEVDVFGQRVGVDVDFPQGLGLVLESAGFLDEGTGLRNLMMLASIRGVVGEREAREALGRVGLDADDVRPFSAYSMGMRQRLDIAQAIMEAPELLILDEPTNALDVGGNRNRVAHRPRGARARMYGACGLPQRARARSAVRTRMAHVRRAHCGGGR